MSGWIDILDELLGTDDKSWYRRRSYAVAVGLSDSLPFSHAFSFPMIRIDILFSQAGSFPTIRIDVGFESRRSRPAIWVRYWLVDSTDSVNETFKIRPMSSSESAYGLQEWNKVRGRGHETAVWTMKSILLPEHVSPQVRSFAYQLLQSNPALAAASAIGASDGFKLGSIAG